MVTTSPPISRRQGAPPPPVPPRGATAVEDKHRVLEIPPPPGRREKVVDDATDALAAKYAGEVTKAEDTIDEFGLTIEVTRLRDRLHRSVGTDLQRLLLSTPGVTELLFNEAIAQQLEEEEEASTPVKDESVVTVATQIEYASAKIDHALSAINETTKQFQASTLQIVKAVGDVAKAIKDEDEYPGPEATGTRPGNQVTRAAGRTGAGGRNKTPKTSPTEEPGS